jgi:hypothetical protein
MRYFTPERWLKLQHVEDEQAFYSAHTEWEQALADYRKELEQTIPRLPPDLRRFMVRECLHDATVLADWRGRSRLTILLRPEPPAPRLFLLNYTLVEPPSVVLSALPREYRTEHAVWMYDEVGVEEGESMNGDLVFNHCILLSDGREVRLRFTRFRFSQPELGLPVAEPQTIEVISPLSHSA